MSVASCAEVTSVVKDMILLRGHLEHVFRGSDTVRSDSNQNISLASMARFFFVYIDIAYPIRYN